MSKIPATELNAPGVLCQTASGQEFTITSTADRSRFTLWKNIGAEHERVASSADIAKLYQKIPWN